MQNGINHSTRNTFANQKLNLCMAGRSVLEEEVYKRKRREGESEKDRGGGASATANVDALCHHF